MFTVSVNAKLPMTKFIENKKVGIDISNTYGKLTFGVIVTSDPTTVTFVIVTLLSAILATTIGSGIGENDPTIYVSPSKISEYGGYTCRFGASGSSGGDGGVGGVTCVGVTIATVTLGIIIDGVDLGFAANRWAFFGLANSRVITPGLLNLSLGVIDITININGYDNH